LNLYDLLNLYHASNGFILMYAVTYAQMNAD